ncbi:MAG: hypothetical protein CMJ87_08215, partial [Planctomycetes bacterium]|nr:hypothetical protein [Planctomycetota bacterium]
MGNDTDVDGNPINLVSVDQGGNGLVVINEPALNGLSALAQTGQVTYTPNVGFIGTDQFTYYIV